MRHRNRVVVGFTQQILDPAKYFCVSLDARCREQACEEIHQVAQTFGIDAHLMARFRCELAQVCAVPEQLAMTPADAL